MHALHAEIEEPGSTPTETEQFDVRGGVAQQTSASRGRITGKPVTLGTAHIPFMRLAVPRRQFEHE